MATGAKLNEDKEWLREAIGEYIEEEMGTKSGSLTTLQPVALIKNRRG